MSRGLLRPTRAELGAALASAALFALAFPPLTLVVPAFVCLVPLALGVARLADEPARARDEGAWGGARIGFWFGILGYGATLYWLASALALYTSLALLGYVGALLVLAAQTAAAGAALFAARRATRWPLVLLLPVVWVALEVLLARLPQLAFPWLPLGLATAPVPRLAQLADLSGVRGVSFWIALTNGLLADAWLARARARAVVARLAAAALLFAAVAAYGTYRLRTTVMRPAGAIGVVQPNIPQDEKWQGENRERIVGITAGLTRELVARRDAALVVWPEASLPGFISEHRDWADTLRALAAPAHTPILFGVLDVVWHGPGDYDYYNAAMLTDAAGNVGRHRAYYKSFLVPVVERVPFVNPRWFAGLRYFGGFGRGTETPLYALPFGRVGVLICYESIFPRLARRYRVEGADVLLNITNDAWFGRSVAPYQHESQLVLRAIENRVGIVRSANTGISAYIDPLGRVHGATELFVRATRTYHAQTTDVRSPYVRLGDWVGALCVVTALLLVGFSWRLYATGRGDARSRSAA